MAITPSDISSNYIINFLSGSISREDRILIKTTPGQVTGKKVTFTASMGFGSFIAGEVLRVSDGTTTIDFTATESGGSDHADADKFGVGSDRAVNLVVDELVSKINSSALDITAVDNGGSSTNASFTLTPGVGKTLTILEDPGGNNEIDDDFTDAAATITNVSSSPTTKKYKSSPFRFLSHGAFNIRGQTTTNVYKTFVGDQKS